MIEEVENLIIGAGLSGLMMGYLLKRNFKIIDAAPGPRFGADAPFYLHAPLGWLPTQWQEVDVHQNIWNGSQFSKTPTIKDMNDYARKITGKVIDTSLKFMDGSIKKGFIPSSGGSDQILKDLYDDVEWNVVWGAKVVKISLDDKKVDAMCSLPGDPSQVKQQYRYKRMISTMPLPALLSLSGQPLPCSFSSDTIYSSSWDVPQNDTMETFQIIYITSTSHSAYRASLIGNKIIIESMYAGASEFDEAQLIQSLWGFENCKFNSKATIRPGKFHPISEGKRKVIVNELTSKSSVYSLGRYATWQYKRIDHISEDAHSILKMIKETR